MTRASTPGSLSTRTAMACRSKSATLVNSDENHALLGDRLLGFVLGAEQHLVVGRTGRDHWETVLGLIDRDIEDHCTVDRQHLLDSSVELCRALGPQSDCAEGFGQLDKIGKGRRIALGISAAMQQFL